MTKRLETVSDLMALAARFADEAKALGARAVIVAVSIDQPEPDPAQGVRHSLYGYAHRGPCLDLDGLARRITQATDTNWQHRIAQVPQAWKVGYTCDHSVARPISGAEGTFWHCGGCDRSFPERPPNAREQALQSQAVSAKGAAFDAEEASFAQLKADLDAFKADTH